MDRETLNDILDRLNDTTLKVDVEGLVYDGEDDGHTPEDVEEAIAELEGELAALRAVLAWAKKAPKRSPVAK